jgi:hypothetical protein
MLGRLRMSITDCIDAYTSLSDEVFEKRRHRLSIRGRIQGRFDTVALERAVQGMLMRQGFEKDGLLKDTPDATCKVYGKED